jgi:hypothetical protein
MTLRKGVLAFFRALPRQEESADLFVDGFWRVDYFHQQSKAESMCGGCPWGC